MFIPPTPTAPLLAPPRPAPTRRRRRLGWALVIFPLAPLVLALLWLRFFGLPATLKDRLLAEIERRQILPFPLAVDRLLLDPTGGVLAERVTVFRDATHQDIMLQVDRIRIGLGWLSWWRGRGLIDGASISNAEVRYPVGTSETADFREVNARVAIDGHDIKVESASARLLNLALNVRGTIHNEGFAATKKTTPAQLAARDDIWRTIVRAMDDVGTERPIDVTLEFETGSHELTAGHANFELESRHLSWRTAPVAELTIHGSLSDGIVALNDFRVDLGRGELTAFGEWNLAERTAQLQFTSSLDFTRLAPAFPGPLGRALERLDFPYTAPSMTGRVLFDLAAGFHADVQADLSWRDFTFNGVAFDRLDIPLAYDGHRLLIPGLKVAGRAGALDLELFFDESRPTSPLQGKLTSSLDPTVLKGVFGPGLDNFLGSCAFPAGGPKLTALATGTALKTRAWKIEGTFSADQFTYKGARFDAATSNFSFIDARLNLPNLLLRRPEGTGAGAIAYDFANRTVRLTNLTSQVTVADVAPMLGPKFTEYTRPYRFTRPPLLRANGMVDLRSENKELTTDLTIQIEGRSVMEWTLFGIPYIFDRPEGTLVFRGRHLDVALKQCGFYAGQLTGLLKMNLEKSPAPYNLDLDLAKIDFQRFMNRSFGYKKSTGTMTAQTKLAGQIGENRSMTGTGELRIVEGDITQIPFLGPLTPLIPGLSAADSAHGHFTIKRGLVMTDDLDISSATLALIGTGHYDFVADALDLDMRANAKSLFGIVLFPLSKIFEYHGTGPMKNPVWLPKNF